MLIQFSAIHKHYEMGDHVCVALENIDVSIAEGEMVALIGPSGSGKTTMMQIMGLLDTPSSGSYKFNGQELSTLSSDAQARLRNQSLGFVFQSFFLLPRLSAWQNVALPLTYRDLGQAEIKQRAIEALEQVGLHDRIEHRPTELSGGQQQRVAIARALVGQPELLLADEPTGALDSTTGKAVMQLLLDLNQQHGHTIVLVTHDPKIAAQCERIIQIKDGRIQTDSSNARENAVEK